MKVYDSALDLIGNTPLVELKNIERLYNLKGRLFAKIEKNNPGGSIKDRVAKEMIESLESEGKINKDTLIIEPTSGNTGIGLALIGKIKGYKVVIVMPDSMSIERRKTILSYGAELVLTEGSKGMKGSIDEALKIRDKNPNSIIAGQFENLANPRAHYKTTAKEISDALDSHVDLFVAGIGTGGTITGCAKFFKERNENIKIIGVEPFSSPLLTKGYAGSHKIQGIGANFIPSILDRTLIDEVLDISNEDSFECARLCAKEEGILVGISSGAALKGAIEILKREESAGKTLVVIFPDGGEKYLSTELFNYE
ncbi:MAG: cysteine synthase A [Gammaproteobacteria bacterium]|nr:cysteine synthase A [Gammaproteobacteria bacterium]